MVLNLLLLFFLSFSWRFSLLFCCGFKVKQVFRAKIIRAKTNHSQSATQLDRQSYTIRPTSSTGEKPQLNVPNSHTRMQNLLQNRTQRNPQQQQRRHHCKRSNAPAQYQTQAGPPSDILLVCVVFTTTMATTATTMLMFTFTLQK